MSADDLKPQVITTADVLPPKPTTPPPTGPKDMVLSAGISSVATVMGGPPPAPKPPAYD